uniref:Palmitoyltransferase n=1 Tax=Ciona savignyi TaxID=51511 RepID=H2YDA1_CIOSA
SASGAMTKLGSNDLVILVLKMRTIWFRCSISCAKIKQWFQYMRLCYKSLTYNSFDSTVESAFEPIFCIVDFSVRWFGVQPPGVPLTSLCKRCILPKPPRTHHCSVCKNCRLKMDHHCPWINNCVGHFNHRYFMSFCIFMVMGTIYVSLSSWVLFNDYEETKIRHPSPPNTCTGKDRSYNSSVVYLWILCSAVTVALGLLTLWHMLLICRGETSIEKLINEKDTIRLRKRNVKFVNPYHFGIVENWKMLLGFSNWKSFLRKVVLPSTHLPDGDGIVWK